MKRRRRRRRSTSTRAPARRRSSAPRRRRRRNPEGGGSAITLSSGFRDWGAVLLGHAALAWGLRTFGDPWGGASGATSPYAGQAWSFKNYGYALGVGYVLAKLLAKSKGGHFAQVFWQTICREVMRRFVWTEGIARIPGAQAYLGQDPGLTGAAPGNVMRDQYGNTWQMDHMGQWVTMQGLTPERALDGYDGGDEQLVVERPLDGLTGARSIDRADGGYGSRYLSDFQQRSGTGQRIRDAYRGTKYADPYSSVYA